MSANPTRAEALALVQEFNSSEALRRHALAVEAAMRHFARLRGFAGIPAAGLEPATRGL